MTTKSKHPDLVAHWTWYACEYPERQRTAQTAYWIEGCRACFVAAEAELLLGGDRIFTNFEHDWSRHWLSELLEENRHRFYE